MKRIHCTLNHVLCPQGGSGSSSDIKKFVGNHEARYEDGSSFNMPPGHWKAQSTRNSFVYKLDKIYDQLLNANKVLKKTGCLLSH